MDALENFTGAATDDLFKATAADFQALDSIDGGEGTDTLRVVDTAAFTGFAGATIKGIETVSISSGAIGSIAATAITNQAAQAQVATVTANATGSTFVSTDTLTITIGSAVYTTTVGGGGGASAAATAIAKVLSDHLGDDAGNGGALEGLVDVAATTNVVTLTSKKAGTALPAITVKSGGADKDDTFSVSASATANKVATGPGAIKEVLTISVDAVAGTSASAGEDLAIGEAIRVSVGGVDFSIASTGTTATSAATDIAAALNTALGAGSAVATGGVVTVTAATAGTALPYIDVGVAGATKFAESYAITVANQEANTAAASTSLIAAPTGVTSYTAVAAGVAAVSAATTSKIDVTGTAVRSSGGSDVTVTASNSVHVSGAKGAVTIKTGNTSTTMIGAVAADTASGSATDASGVYVYGGTNVTITGTKDTAAVKVGTAAFAIDSVNTTGGLPQVNGSASSDPTGDVSITRVSAAADASTGLLVSTWSGSTAKVYMNGGSTATVRGAGVTDIVDVNTFALNNASNVSTIGTSKLATVNLSGLSNTANITSDAMSTVSVTNSRSAVTVNVLNSGATGANSGPINYVLSNVGTEGANPARVTLANNTTGTVNISSGAASTYTGSTNVGSGSFVTISSTKATAINLTNSLAVNLGDVQASAAKVATVTGGSATGSISLTIGTTVSTPEQGLSVTTGSGNDTVTVKASSNLGVNTTTAAVTAVNLGAGNDTLLNLNGSPVTVTGAAFNGGEGLDTVAASLLNSGNVAQFTSFEVLGLDLVAANASFDVSLLTGAAGLALLATSATSGSGNTVTYSGVKASQSLTIAAAAAAADSVTVLGFEAAVGTGTSDNYTVSLGASAPTSTVLSRTTVNAGILSINGIENVTVASGGSGFLDNNIDLANTSARTVTLTGSQNLDLAFAQSGSVDFGGASSAVTATSGAGVSVIDGSALTGGLTINTTNVTSAFAGLTVKGGAGNDVITLAQVAAVQAGAGDDTITAANGAGSVFTGGAGKNTFVVSSAVGATAEVTISDIKSADKIDLAGTVTAGTLGAKVDVSAATSLAVALDIANGTTGANSSATTGSAQLLWFQYGGNTYVYSDVADANGALGSVDANDNIVALTGLVDLIGSTFTAGAILTIA